MRAEKLERGDESYTQSVRVSKLAFSTPAIPTYDGFCRMKEEARKSEVQSGSIQGPAVRIGVGHC